MDRPALAGGRRGRRRGRHAWPSVKARELDVARAEALADPFVRQVMQVFPGAEVTEIRNLAPPEPAAATVEDDSDDDDAED